MFSGEEAGAEAGPLTDVFANDGLEFQTSPPSAAHDDGLQEDPGHFGSSNLNPESSLSTSIAALVEHGSVHDQEGAPAEKASTIIRDRANTLSGDATLPNSFESRPVVLRQGALTLREWAVTGSLMVYGEKKERWSAAHFVDLALWVGGPDAGIQAARALNIFGVWNPSGDYNPHFDRKSIRVCQDHRTILGRIWPEENDGSRLLAWANHYSSTTEQPFNNFVDAHSYLLRQCIGENLKLFSSLARDFAQVGEVSSRIISRAYFDSTLALILREHFDTNVDLELAFEAVVASQAGSLDRRPVKRVNTGREPRLAIPRGDNGRHQRKARHKQPVNCMGQYDDGEDDSEHELQKPAKPIKNEFDGKEELARDRSKPRQQNWTPQETNICLEIIRQTFLKHQDTRLRRNEVAKRLQAEHNIYRSLLSIGNKWLNEWRYLPEFRKMMYRHKSKRVKADRRRNANDCDPQEQAYESGGEGNEIDDSNDADEAVHAEENVAEDEPEDVAEDRADEIEDATQTPLEGPVDEQNFVPRRQPRNPQDLNIGRLTRGVARTSERITNDIYQQSLDISPDVIAEFINTRNPRSSHNWREVLRHRTANGMMVAGREDRPPYPSNNPLVDSSRTHHTRQNTQANLYSEYLSNIQSDVDRLKNLAQSQQGSSLSPDARGLLAPLEPCPAHNSAFREIAVDMAAVIEYEESMYAPTENAQTVDMVLGDKFRTVEDKEQTADVQTTKMAEGETDTLVDEEDNAWSVISGGDGAMNDENERLYCEDEADDEHEVDDAGQDADVDQEDLYGCTDDEETFDNTLIDDDEEEHLDDCTEEDIRVREVEKQLQACSQEAWEYECDLMKRHNEELDDLKREHEQEINHLTMALQEKVQHVDMCRTEIYRRRAFEVGKSMQLEEIKRQHKTECNRERARADEAEQQLKITEKKLEACREDFCTRLYAAKQGHRNKLQEMQDKHDQELEEPKRRQLQTYDQLVKAAEEDAERFRQKAARDADLCADAAEVLSAQIKQNEMMKAEFKKRLKDADSRYDQEVKRGHVEREWLTNEACEMLKKTNKVNDENLRLREELAEAVNDIQELAQKVQTTKAGHDQEIARLKEEAQRQHVQALDKLEDEHEQDFDELVDEYEQDCAELADYLWEADKEIDELRQREQDMETKHKQEMSQAKAG
ncbi:hypothetical protein KCU97_g4205, partial [Aureobasidium melanogenum]